MLTVAACVLVALVFWVPRRSQRFAHRPAPLPVHTPAQTRGERSPVPPVATKSRPANSDTASVTVQRAAEQATADRLAPPKLDPSVTERAKQFLADAFDKYDITPAEYDVSCYPHVCKAHLAFWSKMELAKLDRVPSDPALHTDVGPLEKYGDEGFAVSLFFTPQEEYPVP